MFAGENYVLSEIKDTGTGIAAAKLIRNSTVLSDEHLTAEYRAVHASDCTAERIVELSHGTSVKANRAKEAFQYHSNTRKLHKEQYER
jgi:hypothetical protein